MKVLINAYACSPKRGSEPGIGWNWSVEIAKYCQVIVITEGVYRQEIEEGLATLSYKDNIKFVYNNVSEKVRTMCKNQGDWRFYWYYRKWQRKTLSIAREICKKEKVDVIHQLTMQGFREPGLLWKIDGPKYVWGPVGGVENMPLAYLKGAGIKVKCFYTIKNVINNLQFLFQPNVHSSFLRADVIISSTLGTQKLMEKYYKKESILINDTGCDANIYKGAVEKFNKDGFFHLIWVGKFDFRKQLELALKIMYELRDIPVKLHILGTGDCIKYKKLAENMGVNERCVWYGLVDHGKVNDCMQRADLFLFTSIHESTSTVIVEAIQNHLPIVCHDACGFGTVVSEKIGRKIPINTPTSSIKGFAKAIRCLYENPLLLREMSNNCAYLMDNLTWKFKAKKMIDIYKQITG